MSCDFMRIYTHYTIKVYKYTLYCDGRASALVIRSTSPRARVIGRSLALLTALQWRKAALTRRRSTDAPEECWHIYCGDVHAGTIAVPAKALSALCWQIDCRAALAYSNRHGLQDDLTVTLGRSPVSPGFCGPVSEGARFKRIGPPGIGARRPLHDQMV